MIADELAAAAPSDYNIEILGISWGTTTFNQLMTDGRNMPWLQDTTGGSVTANWGAGYRDFIFIDPANERLVDGYSLTDNDLADPANRAELKAILLGLAELKDEDDDKISDYWEDQMFDGDRSAGLSDDRDQDNSDGLLEYGLGSHAGDPASLPIMSTGFLTSGGEQYQAISFRSRLGTAGGLEYTVEFSRDGILWSSAPEDVVEYGRLNPYDGTGTEIVIFRAVRPASEQARGFLRVRVGMP